MKYNAGAYNGQVNGFFATADEGEKIPVAINCGDGLIVARAEISGELGTFMAKSDDSRGRVLASIMAMNNIIEVAADATVE